MSILIYSQQLLQIRDSAGTILNDDTVFVYGNLTDAKLHVDYGYIHVINTGLNSLNVNCRKEEIAVIPASKNSFCWNVCVSANSAGTFPVQDIGPLPISAGGINDTNFASYHYPEGNGGYNIYKYSFYNVGDPNKSSSFYIVYDLTETGGDDLSPTVKTHVSVCPVPSDQFVYVQLTDNSNAGNLDGEWTIFNVAGEQVNRGVIDNHGDSEIEISKYPQGLYFCTIIVNGNILISKKIFVLHDL